MPLTLLDSRLITRTLRKEVLAGKTLAKHVLARSLSPVTLDAMDNRNQFSSAPSLQDRVITHHSRSDPYHPNANIQDTIRP